jgi:hypothetical protein
MCAANQPPIPAASYDTIVNLLKDSYADLIHTIKASTADIKNEIRTTKKEILTMKKESHTSSKELNEKLDSIQGSLDDLRGGYTEDYLRENVIDRGLFTRQYASRCLVRGLGDLASLFSSSETSAKTFYFTRNRRIAPE